MTKPRPKLKMLPELSISACRWLLRGQYSVWYFLTFRVERKARLFWRRHESYVLDHWVRRHPGTRPKLWWKYSAPEMRLRLGGTGTPLSECSAYAPRFESGIPADWRTVENNYLVDGTPVDPFDPPRFESMASYLQRLDLFLPGERRRVPQRQFRQLIIVISGNKVATRWAA